MKYPKMVVASLLLVASASGMSEELANTASVEASAAVTAEAAAPAPAPAATAEVGKPEAGKAQVVFFRPSKMVGALIGFKVREADTELGRLGNGDYFVLSAEPGKHEYTVHSEAKDVLTMELEAGEVYYVQGSLNMGFLVGRPNLAPSSSDAFNAIRDKLDLSTL